MLYINRIKLLCETKKVTLKHLATQIGVSETGLHKMLNNNSLKVSTLENIAKFFKVSITYFFEESGQNSNQVNIDEFLAGLKEVVLDKINKNERS